MLTKLSVLCRWTMIGLIIFLSGLLMFNAARSDSAIVDELAHIPAGYSYVRFLDYRLNPEHPPLVKALAALPLLFQKLNFPRQSQAWTMEVNSQWTVGNQFLYASGNNADHIIFWSRVIPIALTLMLVALVYIWAKELVGRWWALLPTLLLAFSPQVLAHGHYVTTDIGAALGIFLATLLYVRFLVRPSGTRLWWAGIAFGIAQLMKFSAALLIPYFFLLTFIAYLIAPHPKRIWSYAWSLFLAMLIGYALVFLAYALFAWNYPREKQVADTDVILRTFQPQLLAEVMVWLSGIPIVRHFAHYLLGLFMVLQRATGGNTVYFLGEISNTGWWYYFPVAFLLKEPIPSLLLVVATLTASIWEFLKSLVQILFGKIRKVLDRINTYFPEFAMGLFIMLYWGYSIQSNLNIGVRHVLPTLPFIYILTAGVVKKWFSIDEFSRIRNFLFKIVIIYNEFLSLSLKSLAFLGLALWYIITPLVITPHFLSYYNIFGGGLSGGYRFITDSNYDWGQDLKRLAAYVEQVNIGKIAVDYFGGGNPRYYLGEKFEPWWSARGNPALEGILWLAVSINTIQGAKGHLGPGQQRKPEDGYQWLQEPYKPYARAGTSIFIYKLE